MSLQVRRWLLAAVMALSVVVPFIPAGQAEAAPFGRPPYRGYFFGQCDDQGGFVLSAGIFPTANPLYNGRPYVEDFINKIMGHLGGGGRNRTGAEYIILSMMGRPAGTSKAVAHDPAVIQAWKDAVHAYSDQGWIRFYVPNYPFTENTYYQGVNGVKPNSPGCTGNPDDVGWYPDSGTAPLAIEFHKPGGGFYVIKQDCANPLGDANPLAPADYNVDLTATGLATPNFAELPVSGSGTPGDPYKVIANHKYGVSAVVTNYGPANSAAGLLQVLKPGAVCAPGGGCPLYADNTHSAGTVVYSQGYQPIWPGWFWNTAPIPNSGYISALMNFTPTGTVGTTFTLDVYYAPTNLAGTQEHVGLVYTIVSQRTPNVVATNGDIHAGGGVCNTGISSDGTVKGYPGAGSGGQYVVSASTLGGINGVSSNGTGADTLRLGNNGGYVRICRPDLVKAATSYQLVGGYTSVGGLVDVGTLNPAYEVYYSTGGALKLQGTVNRKITIVALSGTVEIVGNITRSPANYAKNAQPSLGIIAAGNILVHANVSQVDAYLFANGIIDTCVEATTACALPGLLTVNGFVMSNTLSLHRLGQKDTNGAVAAERVVLTPQIYLNPPKLFDASVDDLLLDGQGEKQPLF